MPMRVGPTAPGPDPGAPDPNRGAPTYADNPNRKEKAPDDDSIVGDAVQAAGWGCLAFECFDCLSFLVIAAVGTGVVAWRRRAAARAGA
ncbi:MAG: hypothetical protein QOE92_849 [Chloroflexota bacterium]|jgi:hypothetical protein|nr:hypothetical protein [Chloroflexota bacterium]